MKKKLLVLLFILPFVFSSCSKNDDNEKNYELEGTVWDLIDDYGEVRVLTFEKTSFTMTYEYKGDKDVFYGNYKYTPPYVILYDETDEVKFKVEGDLMKSINSEDEFFYKKRK